MSSSRITNEGCVQTPQSECHTITSVMLLMKSKLLLFCSRLNKKARRGRLNTPECAHLSCRFDLRSSFLGADL